MVLVQTSVGASRSPASRVTAMAGVGVSPQEETDGLDRGRDLRDISTSAPASEPFPTMEELYRSASDGAAATVNYAPTLSSSHQFDPSTSLYSLSHRGDVAYPRALTRDSRRRTDPVYLRPHSESPTMRYTHTHTNRYDLEALRLNDHDRRKEKERTELIEMILESIANVPMALEKIHTNERLRAALEQEIGGEHALLHRLFDTSPRDIAGGPSQYGGEVSDAWGAHRSTDEEADGDEDQDNDEDDSSEYDSEYENDLAEAVNQLVMSDAMLTSEIHGISAPIVISKGEAADQTSNKASSSPQSSIFGASPNAYSQDGEPAAALWPRQPHQFAFTQEEEEEEVGARVQDEVYSEMMASMGEDESFLEEEQNDFAELDKVFEMDECESDSESEESEGNGFADRILTDNPSDAFEGEQEIHRTLNDILDEDEEDEGEHAEGENDSDDYDVVELRIIRQKERTGFEASEDWQPRIGSMIAGRYRVQMEIGEAVFSRTYKCEDVSLDQSVCLKVIKNSKEYFDQGIDEIRVLQYIAERCDVDEKHLVKMFDFFYFREHLVIVTELLRDNLYEFSKLLMERGHINYFSMPRLKRVAMQVLEGLAFLHSISIVHCDLKPENILISNFNECSVKIIDFGSACFVTDDLTCYVQSRSYRAPEVILGLSYDQKIDVWSLGCVLAELYTGEVLFKNDSEQSLLERIIGAVGPIPADLLQENSELLLQFTENPAFALDLTTGDGLLSRHHEPLPVLESLVETTDALFLDFLHGLLQIDPSQRLSASEALQHPWLQTGVFSRSALVATP